MALSVRMYDDPFSGPSFNLKSKAMQYITQRRTFLYLVYNKIDFIAVCIINKLSGISQNKNIMIETLDSTMKKTEQNNTSPIDGSTTPNAHAL
jgi:hypothetical protein